MFHSKDEQLNEEDLLWKECPTDIIIIDISSKKEKSATEGIPVKMIRAKARLLTDKKAPVTEDFVIKETASVKENASANEGGGI